MKCDRCKKETINLAMSMFNTQDVCMSCEEKERKHPMYEKAKEAELEATKNENYNFRGIGLPVDL